MSLALPLPGILRPSRPAAPFLKVGNWRIHRAWIMLAILAIVQVIGQGICMASGIIVAPLADGHHGFGWSITRISMAIALFYVVSGLCCPFSGRLGDRIGARTVMLFCGLSFMGGMFLVGLSTHVWMFFLGYCLWLAMTSSLVIVPLQSAINGWFRRYLGVAAGILTASGGIGGTLFAPVMAELLQAFGWREAFLIVGFTGGAVILAMTPFFYSHPSELGLESRGASLRRRFSLEVEQLRFRVFSRHMRRTRAFWCLPVIHFLAAGGSKTVLVFIVYIVHEQRGASLTDSALILASINFFGILGSLTMPTLVDRFGGKVMLLASLGIQAATVPLLFVVQDLWLHYILGAVFGLGFGAEMSAFIVTNRKYFGDGPLSSFFGMEIMGAFMGTAVAIGLSGFVMDLTGNLQLAMFFSVGFILAAMLVAAMLEPSHRMLIPEWENELPPEARSTWVQTAPSPPSAPGLTGARIRLVALQSH